MIRNTENRGVEKKVDEEIMEKLGTQQKLTPEATHRVQVKLGLAKGLALDKGISEDPVKAMLCQLSSLVGSNGQRVDHEHPSCWKAGKYNL